MTAINHPKGCSCGAPDCQQRIADLQGVAYDPEHMTELKLSHHGMEYAIHQTEDGLFDVRDVAGLRPVGLRAEGPWESNLDAIDAIESMSVEQASE